MSERYRSPTTIMHGWPHTGVAVATENNLPSANITEALETCPLYKLEH